MGVIIKGTDDTVKAADGSLSIEGFSIKTTGIGTFDGGIQIGSAATISSNGNMTVSGILTASTYHGDGSALTGIAGTEITDSDFQVGVSTFMVDYTAGRVGVGTDVPARQFDVYSPTSGVNLITLRTGAGAYGQAGIAFASNSTASREKASIFFQERTGGAHHAGDLCFSVDNASGDAGTAGLAEERLRIQGAGHVGIGTSMPTDRAASSNTRILNVGIVTTNTVYATTFVTSEGQLSNRNVIINGGCIVAQRSTSSTSSDYGSVDRMKMSVTNTDELAFAQKQTTDYPNGFSKCFEFDVTTAESALAADELVYMRYLVEAQDLRPFYNADGTGKDFTLSFWVKAKQTGDYSIGIHKEDNTTRFITKAYTIAVADTWQFVEWNITGDTGTSGINADNGQGFQISFIFAAGTNFTSGGVQSSWGAFSNSLMAGGQAVNTLDNTANYWRMTGLQLEVGSKATPFEHRSYGEELLRCQRYYQRFGENFGTAFAGKGSGSTTILFAVPLAVALRASPTVTQAGNVYQWGPSNAGYENATVSVSKWMANVPQIWLTQAEHSTVADDRCLVVTPYGGSSGADPDLALSAEL